MPQLAPIYAAMSPALSNLTGMLARTLNTATMLQIRMPRFQKTGSMMAGLPEALALGAVHSSRISDQMAGVLDGRRVWGIQPSLHAACAGVKPGGRVAVAG